MIKGTDPYASWDGGTSDSDSKLNNKNTTYNTRMLLYFLQKGVISTNKLSDQNTDFINQPYAENI